MGSLPQVEEGLALVEEDGLPQVEEDGLEVSVEGRLALVEGFGESVYWHWWSWWRILARMY